MGNESIGKIISIIARQNQMYLVKEMNKIGISGSEYIFIANIPDKGFATQQQICNEFEVDPAFATRSVNSLVKKGYVEKLKSKLDKRSYELRLTENGLLKKRQVRDRLDYWTEVLKGDMDDLEVDALLKVLLELKERAGNELQTRGTKDHGKE